MRGPVFGRFSGQAAFMGVALGLLASAAGLGGIGWRAYEDVSREASRYSSYKALQRDAGKADSLSTLYASAHDDIQRIRAVLPPQNQGSQVLNILVEDAGRFDLGIAGITALDEVPFPGYKELPFELNLSGSFPELVRYLHALETRGMVLEVRRLSAKAEAINKARITAKLDLSVFVPEGSVATGAAEGAATAGTAP